MVLHGSWRAASSRGAARSAAFSLNALIYVALMVTPVTIAQPFLPVGSARAAARCVLLL
jgi:hypothetical protein